MSAAASAVEAPPAKGKKKLIIIVLALVLLLVLGTGAALFLLKKKPADDGTDEGDDPDAVQVEKKPKPKREHAKADPKHPPVFVPLEPFVVNLADRDSDRYAQIGVTLQVEDEKAGEQIKAYLPAIRNNILLLLSHKGSAELMEAGGKERLAQQILRESVLPMGVELEDPEAASSDPVPGPKKRRHAYDTIDDSPVKAVQFSSFIIQ